MSHEELVLRAEKWLYNKGCWVVFREIHTALSEIPDAIGFNRNSSILIECKTSLQDFRADKYKNFRAKSDLGLGQYRWYMTPAKLVKPEDLPKNWGLLWVYDKTIRIKKNPIVFKSNKIKESELFLCITALRRFYHKGLLVRNNYTYTKDTTMR